VDVDVDVVAGGTTLGDAVCDGGTTSLGLVGHGTGIRSCAHAPRATAR
jgi:hypothetical protein